MPTATIETPGAAQHLAGKYLTFTLHDESYGIHVLKIREIIRLTDITTVPQMPAYVRGVINLRGKIIIIDDRKTVRGKRDKFDDVQFDAGINLGFTRSAPDYKWAGIA